MADSVTWDELEKGPIGPFRIAPHYDRDGDTLTLFIKPDEAYRERIDKLVTVYRSFATKEVVGCHIKGVRKKLLRAIKGFAVNIESGNLTLGLLLMGLAYTDSDKNQIETHNYREVVETVQPIIDSIGSTPLPDLVEA
ncbi:MAG: hypothetical protein HY292_03215 [Planctomycetes bacterium]|nr:hypothetical protein [Planctomycetota bacterium]